MKFTKCLSSEEHNAFHVMYSLTTCGSIGNQLFPLHNFGETEALCFVICSNYEVSKVRLYNSW